VSAQALLDAQDLRIDVAGVPACDGLSLTTRGDRSLILGAPRALFLATTGLLAALRGTLAVGGRPAARAVAEGIVAGAASDPPLPGEWSVVDYVTWSARLTGADGAEAPRIAGAAIEQLQLGTLAKTQIGRLVAHARRATVVASALAARPAIVALDEPLAGLPDDVAAGYAKILVDALQGRRWLLFAGRMPAGTPLFAAADEVVVATATRLEAQGTPGELAAATRRWLGRFAGPPDAVHALGQELSARGARLEREGEGERPRFVVDLGAELSTNGLFAICAEAGVAVVELVPLSRALV
jgi:ABC-2 type transport system ATP-binding protein